MNLNIKLLLFSIFNLVIASACYIPKNKKSEINTSGSGETTNNQNSNNEANNHDSNTDTTTSAINNDKVEIFKAKIAQNPELLNDTLNNAKIKNDEKKDIVKELFRVNPDIANKLIYQEFIVPLSNDNRNINEQEFNNQKVKIINMLTSIFALGDESIINFYDYITPEITQTRLGRDWAMLNISRSKQKSTVILKLILENNLLEKIAYQEKFMPYLAKLSLSSLVNNPKDLVDKLKPELQETYKNEVIKISKDYKF